MTRYDYETWDVFTDRRFAGNQLGVILDARGMSDADMQTVTREFNYAESTFVLAPDDPAHAAKVRIFTPGYEMPFAGHPTVGTAIAIARARGLIGEIKIELKTGVFPVSVLREGARWFAEFVNPNLPAERGAAPEPAAIEAALTLAPGSVARGPHRPRRIGAGVDFYYASAPLDDVRGARINSSAWKALDFKGVIGVLLYAQGGDAPDTDYHVRMFAPDAGVAEDPATGSAAAALPGQLALAGACPEGAREILIEQGVELGRPSRIRVRFQMKGGEVLRVAVGGFAVPVMKGQLEI